MAKKPNQKVKQKNQQMKESNGLPIPPENSNKRSRNSRQGRIRMTYSHVLFSRIFRSNYQQMHNLLFLITKMSLDLSIGYHKKDISAFQTLRPSNTLRTVCWWLKEMIVLRWKSVENTPFRNHCNSPTYFPNDHLYFTQNYWRYWLLLLDKSLYIINQFKVLVKC